MNAQLEVVFSEDSAMLMLLENALLEEFPDGYSLHADSGVSIDISKKNIIDCSNDEDQDEFKIETQGRPVTMRIIWE